MEMCETCQESYQLGLLPEDSLASLSVLPGSNEARQMTVGSGRRWLELLNVSGPAGCLVKMCLESSVWNSTRCYLTWNASTTPHGRLLFRLSASMPRIDESEFGLWPTPTKAIADGGQSSRSGKRKGELLLTGMARMWPTPTVDDSANVTRQSGQFQSLTRTVMFPTPTTQDAHNNGGQSQYNRNTLPLNAVAGGSLNPNWVEWLMGYPPGWTDLEA